MINYLHPKDLAPKILDQALKTYTAEKFLLPSEENKDFNAKEKKILSKAINGYRYRKGFKDKCKGVVYRIIQFVKAIFGRSDWNQALNLLMKANFSRTDCFEVSGKASTDIKNVFAYVNSNQLITPKESSKFLSTYKKVKKTTLDHLLKSLVRLTKEELDPANDKHGPLIEDMINRTCAPSNLPLSESLKKDYDVFLATFSAKWAAREEHS